MRGALVVVLSSVWVLHRRAVRFVFGEMRTEPREIVLFLRRRGLHVLRNLHVFLARLFLRLFVRGELPLRVLHALVLSHGNLLLFVDGERPASVGGPWSGAF